MLSILNREAQFSLCSTPIKNDYFRFCPPHVLFSTNICVPFSYEPSSQLINHLKSSSYSYRSSLHRILDGLFIPLVSMFLSPFTLMCFSSRPPISTAPWKLSSLTCSSFASLEQLMLECGC